MTNFSNVYLNYSLFTLNKKCSGSKPLDKNTTTVLATGSLKYQIQKLRKSIIEKEICMSILHEPAVLLIALYDIVNNE
jgi:hypothetical protein